jgi:hypothetical protein
MIAKHDTHPLDPLTHVAAAALAALITIGIFSGVVELLHHDGRPLERLAAAERACASRAYVSEREACVREWLALQPLVSLFGQ